MFLKKLKSSYSWLASVIMIVVFLFASKSVTAAQDPSLVALFGDSITVGFNQAAQGLRYGNGDLNVGQPAISLSNILNSHQRNSLVANLGVGGTPSGPSGNPALGGSGNGLSRISSDLAAVSNRYGPNRGKFVLIMYGINDMAFSISTSTTGFNVGQTAIRALQSGFVPVVSTITPCICNNQIPVGGRNNAIRQEIASLQANGQPIFFVDQYNLLIPTFASSLVDPDGVHPNNAGYTAIAQNWYDGALRRLVKPVSSLASVYSLLLDEEPTPAP